MLFQLMYYSKVSESVKVTMVAPMLREAAERNAKDGISGFICFSPKYFLQVLEGGRDDVNATYRRICNDTRHHSSVLLGARAVDQRLFARFGMGYMSNISDKRNVYFKFCGGTIFDPSRLTTDGALAMLLESSRVAEDAKELEDQAA